MVFVVMQWFYILVLHIDCEETLIRFDLIILTKLHMKFTSKSN